jgi:hypothetical protein
VTHEPSFRPLLDVPSRRNNSWYVALGHGHFLDEPVGSFRSRLFFSRHRPRHATTCPWSREGFRDVSQGEVRAFYSGSPRIRIGQEQAWVVIVGLGPQGVDVARHPITYTIDGG